MAETVYDAQTRFLDELLSHEQAAAERMIRSYAPVYNRLSLEWQKVLNDIAAIDENATDPRRVANLVFNAQRIEQLRLQTAAEIARFSDDASAQTQRQQAEAIRLGTTHAESLTQLAMNDSAYGFSFSFARLPRGALENLTGSFETGSPLKDLFDQLGPSSAAGAQKVLFNAIATGTNPRIAATQLRDQLGLPLGRALTIARTEQLRSYREANRQSYERNADVVKGWRWVAHIGRRTCALCWAQHGTFHKLGERMGSHPNCRCSMVPVTRSWEEMGFPPEVARLAPPPLDTQRSGIDLFREQSPKDQLAVLGPRKFALYRQHQLAIQDLVVHSNHPRWGLVTREASVREALLLRSTDKPWLILRAPKVEPFVLPIEKPRLPVNPIDHVRALLLKDPTASPTQLALRVMQDYGGNVTVTPLQVTHARQALERQGLIDRRGNATPSRPPTPTTPRAAPVKPLTFAQAMKRDLAAAGPITDEARASEFGRRARIEIEKRVAAASPEPIQKRIDEIVAKMSSLNLGSRGFEHPEWEGLRRQLNKLQLERNALGTTARERRAVMAVKVLGELRQLGEAPGARQTFTRDSDRTVVARLHKALKFYPREWVRRSAQHGSIRGLASRRGQYSESARHILLSNQPGVAPHELGHRMEYRVPGIKDVERQFYERRTAGQELKWLGEPYDQAEVTRADKFLDAYMGKDYRPKGGDAWELLSMGAEALFEGTYDLAKDHDFYDFIMGMLVAL